LRKISDFRPNAGRWALFSFEGRRCGSRRQGASLKFTIVKKRRIYSQIGGVVIKMPKIALLPMAIAFAVKYSLLYLLQVFNKMVCKCHYDDTEKS
jgi:hypothetical protein